MAKRVDRKQPPNDKKLKELVLLIAVKSEGDESFGKVKLNKLMFLADFMAYLDFGKSITGHEYQRLPWGPAPRQLLAIVPAFCKPPEPDADVAIRVNDYHGKQQERPFALRLPDTRVFAPEELMLVENLVSRFAGVNARDMSEMSHRFLGWRLAKDGQTIPYASVLVSEREPTEEERRIGEKLEPLALACLGRLAEHAAA